MKKILLLLFSLFSYQLQATSLQFPSQFIGMPDTGFQTPNYCTTYLYGTGCGAGDYISSFTLSNLSNLKLACIGASDTPEAGYADFTTSEPVINLIQGATYTWTATYAFPSEEYLKIWIDLNDNGTLDDPGELIFDGTLTGYNLANASFTLSTTAATGEHRLRVRDCYNVTNFGPCGVYGNYEGEVQDYSCNIIAPICQIPLSSPVTNVNFTSAQANWTCPGCTGAYIIEYGPAATFTKPGSGDTAGTNSTIINVPAANLSALLSGLQIGTQYTCYVRENCSDSANDYSLNSAPQTFTTLGNLIASQQTGPVPPGSTGVKVLGLSMPISGNIVTLTLDSIKITSKNTNDADITTNGLKLWTGTASGPTTQIGTSQTFSSGAATFRALNLSLITGITYYLWLTYDISTTATINDTLDAKINAGDINFTAGGVATSYPQKIDPAGNLYVYYCAANLYTTGCAASDYISSFSLSNLSNTGLKCIGTSNSQDAGYADFSATEPVINLIQAATYFWTASYAYPSGEYLKIWIDFNDDLNLSDAADLIYDGTLTGYDLASGMFTLPSSAATGKHRLRVRICYNVTNFGPCGVYGNGEGEVQDYTCNITAPKCVIPASSPATNINFSSAQANWSCSACSGAYIVEYGPTATFTAPDSGNSAGPNSTIINVVAGKSDTVISGLTNGTEYTYYVREDCSGSGNGYSLNSAPHTFTTLGALKANQETGPVPPGSKEVKVLGFLMPIAGNIINLTLDSIKITSKNTNDSDISANGVKLWTGTASGPTTQIGTSQTFSSGAATFSGLNLNFNSKTTYYFWLTYDISSAATLKDILDAKINAGALSFTAGGANTTFPQHPIDPAGNLYVYYCSAYLYTTGCIDGDEINSFTISNLSHLNSGCSGDTSNSPDAGYGNFTYPKESVINLVQGATYQWTVTNNYPYGHYVQMWIDYNNDGIFEANEALLSAPLQQPNTSPNSNVPFGSSLTIPSNAATGEHQFRVRLVWQTPDFDACTQYQDGEVQDYTCNIIAPACKIPTFLPATSVGLTSAQANWSCSGCTGSYIVEYGPTATFTVPDTGDTAGPNSNIINVGAGNLSDVISGLANGTEYTYYVRDDCSGSGNGYSLNSAPQTFTTLIPLTVGTIAAIQQTGFTSVGTNNVNILRIDIPASGTLGTLTLDSIKFTSKNTNDADIAANGVKLWTGTISAPVTQIGTAQSFASGSVTFSGLNLSLLNGSTNSLWLTYNISLTATLGDFVDAKIDSGNISITAAGGATNPGSQPPSALDPAGNILIDYCDNNLYSSGCTHGDDITSFSVSNLDNSTSGCSVSLNGDGYSNFTASEPVVKFLQGGTYTWTATNNYGGGHHLQMWIDYNNDGIFETDEALLSVPYPQPNAPNNTPFGSSFTIPSTAQTGNHRFRVRLVWANSSFGACDALYEGDVEDYICNINVSNQNCPIPTSLPATSVGSTSAQANWSCSGCSGAYIVEYGPTATFTAPDTGNTAGSNSKIIDVASTSLATVISGLASATEYTYYVREDCTGSGNGYSTNSAPQKFTTLKPFIIASLTATPDSICTGGFSQFQTVVSGGTGNYHYVWSPAAIGDTLSAFTVSPSQTQIYTIKINDGINTIDTNIVITVNTPPSSNNLYVSQTILLGDSIDYSLSCEGTPPITFQWKHSGVSIPGATNSLFFLNHATCSDSGVYSCVISNICKSISTNIVNLFVLNCCNCGRTISGYVKYDNADSTAMTNTNVYLANAEDTIIDNTTTDAKGYYVFMNLISGTYKLSCSTNKAWGGVNPIDALLVDRTYIHLNKLTDPLKRLAADVNNDGKLNPIDALLIDRRYIHLIHKFTVPDWLFSNPTVNLNNVDVNKETIMAICAGDVNGSYTPPSRIMNYELGIRNNTTLNINPNKPFEIPVYLSSEFGVQSWELGALGIKLRITSHELRIVSIKSDLKGFIYNITDDGVNIAWTAENEGYTVSPDNPLFYITAMSNMSYNLIFNNLISITSESVLADIDANLINTDKLAVPEIVVSSQSSVVSFTCYPNPFSNITNINYTIPEDANVEINLFNILGQKIACLTNEKQQAGNHSLQYDGTNLKQGIYYCELRIEDGELRISKTNMLMIAR